MLIIELLYCLKFCLMKINMLILKNSPCSGIMLEKLYKKGPGLPGVPHCGLWGRAASCSIIS